MQFDNQNFESGVKTTMNTLQKLNEKLKMKDATGGLDDVGKGINKLSSSGISGLAAGVDNITSKFSALGVIGMTALVNLTNSAVNAGKQFAKALTIEPVMTGFHEYETKMGAIQTILTNTAHAGTKLSDVTKVLDELNAYADKTIYNFAEMTKNIGTFTAAGVDLDTSVAAIKGIANLAAASGSNSQQASTAMYQLSQALAAGKVSLADWNSVVNAGMGGKLFQDSLIRTSEVLGTNAEAMIKKYGSFRESLTKGEWLTSEVLTETLKQLSGAYTEADLIAQGFTKSQAKEIVELANNATAAATEVKTMTQLIDTMKESVQSGWATSWEHIIGDKEEATELFTSISQGFEALMKPSTDARNEMLKFWNEAGGRSAVIKGFTNIIQSMGKGLGAVRDAWKEVFPPMTGERLVELSNKFKDFTEKIKMNDSTAKKIKDTFKGVFDVFKTVKTAVGDIVSGFAPLGKVMGNMGSLILTATSGIGRFASTISNAVMSSGIFESVAKGINAALEWLNTALTTTGTGISKFFDAIGKLNFGKAFGVIGKGLGTVANAIKPMIDGIGKALGTINFGTIMKALQTATFIDALKQLKGLFGEVGDVAEEAKSIFSSFKGFGSKVKEVLDGAREALEAWQSNLQAGTLMKLAGAIAILAGSLVLLASIKTEKLIPGLAAMAGIFAELIIALAVIGKVGGFKGLLKTSGSLLAIATSMLMMAAALKTLSGMDLEGMIVGLTGIIGLIGSLGLATKLLGGSHKGLMQTSVSLVIFGAAMLVMAKALDQLGKIDPEVLGQGLFALAGILVELGAFLAASKYGGLSVTTAAGVLVLSAALLVLQQALKGFGELDGGTILTGLAAMAGVLAEIAIFNKLSGSGLGMITTAAGLTVMSVAMLAMSKALASLGAIQWDSIARGLTAMAGGLTVLGVASALISGAKLATVGAGLAVMSASLLLLSAALKAMGSMTWEEIAKGLVTLAGALTILGVAMYAMSGALLGAAAMVVMAGALALLTPQLMLLSQMSLAGVGIALLALAGAFTVIGVAGLLLTPVVPTLIALAAAVALLGVGCAAAGLGLTAIGTGLGLVGAAVAGSGLLIVEFLRQLINLLPQLGVKAAEAMVAFAGALSNGIPQLVAGFTAIFSALLQAAEQLIPQFIDTGIKIVVELVKGIATAIPEIVVAAVEMITALLEGIAANIGQMVEAGIDCVVNFINGVANKLGDVIEAGINLALKFIEGVADGVLNNTGRLESAVSKVIQAMIKAGLAVIKGALGGFVTAGTELIKGVCTGIKNMYSNASSAVRGAITAAKNGAANAGSALISAGKSLVQGLISGIKTMASNVATAARNVVQGAINAAKKALKINSPSKVFIGIGKSTTEGLALGISRYASHASNSATGLANEISDKVRAPLSMVGRMVAQGLEDIDTTPVIAPVVDLTNVEAGAQRIGGLMKNRTMEINATSGRLAGTIGTIQNGPNNDDVVSALKDLKDSMSNNGPSYTINGITYDDGSNVVNAVETLVRAARIERRI